MRDQHGGIDSGAPDGAVGARRGEAADCTGDRRKDKMSDETWLAAWAVRGLLKGQMQPQRKHKSVETASKARVAYPNNAARRTAQHSSDTVHAGHD